MTKSIKKLIFQFLLLTIGATLFSGITFATEGSNALDLLEQAFDPAIQKTTVIGGGSIGTTRESVGQSILQGNTEIKISLKEGVEARKKESLLIQFSKFLLRMTVVLAVTMIIYNGLMYLVKASKGENPKEIVNNIIYIIAGVLLALLSVVIIRVVSSIGKSSVGEITSLPIEHFIV